MPDIPELRVAATDLEVRHKERIIEGVAAPYATWTAVGSYLESFQRGAFAKTTREGAASLPLLALHNSASIPVGRSIGWADSDDGLIGTWLMAPTDDGDRWLELVDGHFVRGLSVGFQPVKQRWEPTDPPRCTRTEVSLRETSLVPVAAYEDARVTLVRTGEHTPTPRLDAARRHLATLRVQD